MSKNLAHGFPLYIPASSLKGQKEYLNMHWHTSLIKEVVTTSKGKIYLIYPLGGSEPISSSHEVKNVTCSVVRSYSISFNVNPKGDRF